MTTKQQIEIGKSYLHVKSGRVYKVIELGKIEATLDDVVIYKSADEPNAHCWVRPYAEFAERFQPV